MVYPLDCDMWAGITLLFCCSYHWLWTVGQACAFIGITCAGSCFGSTDMVVRIGDSGSHHAGISESALEPSRKRLAILVISIPFG